MRSKAKLSIILMIMISGIIVGGILYAQADKPEGGSTAGAGKDDKINFILDDEAKTSRDLLGKDVSKALYKVMLDTFEESGEWYSSMPNDQGLIISRRQMGTPSALLKGEGSKEVLGVPEKVPPKFRKADGTYENRYYVPYPDNKKYVLGVRVDFQKRGNNWFAIYPYRPIKMEGFVKSFEVWVCGRQKNHSLSLIVEDIYGQEVTIPIGKLNFLGWKRLFVNVPDQIAQFDYRFTTKRGLIFKGFLVNCHPLESWGKYYIYFDNLSAEISRFWEEYQDLKDPVDIW